MRDEGVHRRGRRCGVRRTGHTRLRLRRRGTGPRRARAAFGCCPYRSPGPTWTRAASAPFPTGWRWAARRWPSAGGWRARARGGRPGSRPPGAMAADAIDAMAHVERDHWWFRAKRALVVDQLARFGVAERRGPRRRLRHRADWSTTLGADRTVVGAELDEHALAPGRGRWCRGPDWSGPRPTTCPCSPGRSLAVTALDVIEHLDDDVAALHELGRVAAGGLVVVAVPAYPWAWSDHDVRLGPSPPLHPPLPRGGGGRRWPRGPAHDALPLLAHADRASSYAARRPAAFSGVRPRRPASCTRWSTGPSGPSPGSSGGRSGGADLPFGLSILLVARAGAADHVPVASPRMALRSLVVIPTVDEAPNIVEVLQRVRVSVPDAHILVVDGASHDGTPDLAEQVDRELGQIQVLRQAQRNGLGGAYRTGFAVGLGRGLRGPRRDGRRPVPRPGRPPRAAARPWRAAPAWPSARGTYPAAPRRTGPGAGSGSRSGPTATPTPCSAWGCTTPRPASGRTAPTPSGPSTTAPPAPTATGSRWR